MPCTTILVGKAASNNGSTLIARNEDSPSGVYNPKKFVVTLPENQPRKYVSKISKVEIDLPDDPLRYTAVPNAIADNGIWAAAGVNSANVGMTATETITSNQRVFAADPLVPGGIGEEDLVVITLPYIKSAREGVVRLGELLEKYGTYEMNGIAFQDVDEVWWLETIGGHRWMARRVPDDSYVCMPNQLGIDFFDFDDALGEQKEYMCSKDLKEFTEKNRLNLNLDGSFNPRFAFGSNSDSDRVYNTPRAWITQRYFNPGENKWDGDNADYTPMSDNIPWCRKPERKITAEDVKYVLSHHYQGTPYDPYGRGFEAEKRGIYRCIGINRNSFLSLTEIRPDLPEEIRAIEWLAFASNAFNAFVPFYANVDDTPEYLASTTDRVTSENFYWANRLIGALSDAHYSASSKHVERYQLKVSAMGRLIISKHDAEYLAEEKKPSAPSFCKKANDEIAEMLKKETDSVLGQVLFEASELMKNAFSRSDN